jgi:Holliday junction resolvasome RuvABC endonuclease subunit
VFLEAVAEGPSGNRAVTGVTLIHLGLDLSLTSSGIVVFDSSKKTIPYASTAGHSLTAVEGEAHHLARMIGITRRVVKVIAEFKPDTITIEGPAFSRSGRLFDLGGLYYVVATQCRLCYSISPLRVSPTAARKLVLGKGSPPRGVKGKKLKAWVRSLLVERHSLETGQEDCNDALVLALYRDLLIKSGAPKLEPDIEVDERQIQMWGAL